jgi:4a-hydroxytetrahydrobiopterin dehydratase
MASSLSGGGPGDVTALCDDCKRFVAGAVRNFSQTISLRESAMPLISRAMANVLSSKEIKEALKDLPQWEAEGKAIERTFEFDDFSQAIDFVNGVAELAEEEGHHPDIEIHYNKVRLVLSTHSKGGVTDADLDLAEKIDTLVDE